MGEPFQPGIEDFKAIIRDYALQGANDFKKQSSKIKERASQSMRERLIVNDRDIEQAISKMGREDVPGFLPAPYSQNSYFHFAFFRPRLMLGGSGTYEVAVVIFFWVSSKTADGNPDPLGSKIAVRLDPQGTGTNPHAFPHAQFTRTVKFGDETLIVSDVPTWLPTSYPALGIRCDHPIHFFIGLAAAVHGYCADTPENYAPKILSEALAQKASLLHKTLGEMARYFGPLHGA